MGNDRYGVRRVSQSFSITGTSLSNSNVKLNGKLWQVNTLPGALTSGTATITITDADGATVFTGTPTNASAKQADLKTSPILLSGLYTITCTYSVSQTALATTATLIIESV